MRQHCQGVYIQIYRHDTKRERPRSHPWQSREGEQGEARPGNSVPKSGPQLVLSQRRLKPGLNRASRSLRRQGLHIDTCIYNISKFFTTTASSSSGCPTTNASRTRVVYVHIVTAAATPYNARNATATNSMLQQRQHQQYDKQQKQHSG